MKANEAQAALRVAESEEIARTQEKAVVEQELKDADEEADPDKKEKIMKKLEEVAEETKHEAEETAVKKQQVEAAVKENTDASLNDIPITDTPKSAAVNEVIQDVVTSPVPVAAPIEATGAKIMEGALNDDAYKQVVRDPVTRMPLVGPMVVPT